MTDAGPPARGQGGAKAAPAMGAETVERFGHPVRHFPVAVSAEAMALAWANREDGPQGATVMVDHEIGPRGLHGRIWGSAPADSLACAVILRPPVSVEEGDCTWLLAALAAAEGAEAVSGLTLATWWPDSIVSQPGREPLGAVRAEVQLGPGQVKSVIITIRLDLVKLGMGPEGRHRVLEAVLGAVDHQAAALEEGAAGIAAAYEKRCAFLGERVKISLLPKGETRGKASHVDRAARLELESATGMIERIGVDQIRDLQVV